MAVPTSRSEFKEFCLRKLGKPVIEINVDDDQVDDRVDEALAYFWDYHFDGADKEYYKHQITDTDKTNKYITLPENIIGAVNIFDITPMFGGGGDLFNVMYQIALNDMHSLTSFELLPYYMMRTHLENIQQMLVGKKPLRYNRHKNQLHIDMNWDYVNEDQWIIVEAYSIVDPETYVNVWKDRWLARYAACLIKQQWGSNLTKFTGMKLPGGIEFNGAKIYDDATAERAELEKEMIYSYSLPVTDMIG